jgi:putative SOS response-associated peptidase YedK
MCNLKKLAAPTKEVADLFGALDKSGNAGPGEVYPGQIGLVVTQQGEARTLEARTLEPMTWGFPLVTADMRARAKVKGTIPRPKPVNNARMDNMGSPFWKRWFEDPKHRCLIPITEFAEAAGEKGHKTRTWFNLKDQPIFAWAGLWRDNAEWGKVYTGCMTNANEAIQPYHERMPVLLEKEQWQQWLTVGANQALRFATPMPAARIEVTATQELWVRS